MLKAEYQNQWEEERAEGRERLEQVLSEWKNFRALLEERLPEVKSFYRLVLNGRLEEALATGALQQLRKEGYMKTVATHLTCDKLLNRGCLAWSLEWLGSGVLAIDRSSTTPQARDSWQKVDLVIKVDRETRRIDTEFFSLNERSGTTLSDLDDREKLHIIWEVPEEADRELSLVYLGLGTNEPFDLDHPERSHSTLSGRPRFYIYDKDRGVEVKHPVTWKESGSFDFDWSYRPAISKHGQTSLWFVRNGDGLFCLSDPEMAHAASRLTKDRLVELSMRAWGIEGTAPLFEELSPEVQKGLTENFRLLQATVSSMVTDKLPDVPPSLEELLQEASRNYPPYFIGTAAARSTPRDFAVLLKGASRLGPTRHAEYKRFLDWKCREVLELESFEGVPETIEALLSLEDERLPASIRDFVVDWRTHLSQEIQRDLYHYGQDPQERAQLLLLGAMLALSEQYGGLYWRILAAARGCLEGRPAFGSYDAALPE